MPLAAQEGLGLTAEERLEIGRMRRLGELREVLDLLDEVLTDAPGDPWSLLLRGRVRFEQCRYEDALADVGRAFQSALETDTDVVAADAELLGAAARSWSEMLVELGRAPEGIAVLERAGAALQPEADARDALAFAHALREAGRREEATELYRAGAEAAGPSTWQGRLARARCERALGFFRRAARSLVDADKLASEGSGVEPDVLAELGDVYFEVYGEVDDAMTRAHLPSKQYREALDLHPDHEAARLGLFELYRFNWALTRESPSELLRQALEARPRSVRGLLAGVSADLDDGKLREARAGLERLEQLAPGRRDVRAERAALAWIEHDRDRTAEILGELASADPKDSRPDLTVARHLNETYRFGEALPFAESATERDPGDWLAWTEFGRSLANVGREAEALDAFDKAEESAEGRQNAWRTNTRRVIARLSQEYVEEGDGEHTFVWMPDAAAILRTYLIPFYGEHREGLAERYGHTPGPVRIEVFRSWDDFSVRSTGFTGFSALGVCFGPVVTSVSPLSELRGGFSWARTAYHEYTHVVHLSLSHNRCPRWITEGLATWEEEEKNPAWSRNMRGDLLNAYANDNLIPVRDLNRAFRTPRILFAYYQGGLLCRMLIDKYGFSPMIRLLLAFDRGLDLDQAFDEVLGLTPERIDRRFREFVAELVEPLKLEPLWSPSLVVKKRLSLSRTPPEDADERAAWVDDWLTVAWGSLQQGRRVDAEEALRHVRAAELLPPRFHFLRGDLELLRGNAPGARQGYERGLEAGGEGFRVRMALADLALADGDFEAAEAQLLAAERAFPGIAAPMPSAEMKLAELYALQGETESAMEARLRWLAFNAGDSEVRLQVAAWLDGEGRFAESETLYREANEVDPFHRALHRRWGTVLAALGRHEEALREFNVALAVPGELDRDLGPPDPAAPEGQWEADRDAWDADRPELLGRRARALLALGRTEEAQAAAEEALAIDGEAEIATEVLGAL
ncbi:MAG: tetratricopeptide repeat protein [Planctomycetota bacterium]